MGKVSQEDDAPTHTHRTLDADMDCRQLSTVHQ